MRKTCWLLVFVLLLGCFAGCQSQGSSDNQTKERSIENADGTLSDWMKEEIFLAYAEDYFEQNGSYPSRSDFGGQWDPEKPMSKGRRYYGTYNGYIMYSVSLGMQAVMHKEIAGFSFDYAEKHELRAYKDGKFYKLEDLYNQGVINDEAIEIAHNGYCRVVETVRKYREANGT